MLKSTSGAAAVDEIRAAISSVAKPARLAEAEEKLSVLRDETSRLKAELRAAIAAGPGESDTRARLRISDLARDLEAASGRQQRAELGVAGLRRPYAAALGDAARPLGEAARKNAADALADLQTALADLETLDRELERAGAERRFAGIALPLRRIAAELAGLQQR